MNELRLRHIFTYLDGTTSGPSAFTGDIGKSLVTCQTLAVVEFEAINGNLPEFKNTSSLSKDQKYLYDICMAVNNGAVPSTLASKEPGAMVHSRWLRMANRLLRLYVSTLNPPENLQIIAEYIMKVYAPTWFNIKLRPQCFYGAQHLWNVMRLSRYLPDNVRKVVDKCLQHNGYFGHPENILLAMIKDEREEIRELALRRIARAREVKTKGVRKFKIPTLNFNAKDYYEMVDWNNTQRCEPPLTRIFTDNEIEEGIRSRAESVFELDKFPCHTQAVERHIKIVTEASAAVCGELRQDGYIRAKLESQKQMAKYSTKKDWNA